MRKGLVCAMISTALVIGLSVVSVGPISIGAWAQESEQPIEFEKEVKIMGKGEGVVYIWEAPFEVGGQTVIESVAGTSIGLSMLPVPCRAIVRYVKPLDRPQPLLLEVKALEYLDGAESIPIGEQ